MSEADDILRQYETCYAWNDFGFYYKIPMPRHECEEFVNERNQCKGGHWVIRRKVDFEEHFNLLYGQRYGGDGSELLR